MARDLENKVEKKKTKEAAAELAAKYFALDIFNLIIILVLVLFFFQDILLRGQVFFAGDIMNVYSPWQWYNNQALMAGRMPLWSDDLFMGFPLFAESQGALFYPPTRLIYAFIPAVRAFSYDVVLHFLLAGWFQYFFARSLKLPPWSSLFTAIVFAFSGMFMSLPINFTIFRSIVWIPMIFTFMTIGAKRDSLVFPVLAAIAMVFQMMGGSLQVTGITVLALIPYAIFLIVSPGDGRKSSLVPGLQLILMLILACGLYMFQLLPTWELSRLSWRGTEGGFDVASAFSFPPEHFIDLLLPTFFGAYADGSLLPARITATFFPYIGIVPLFLILPSIGSKKRGVFIMFFLGLLFILLALGKFGPIYEYVYKYVPFFDQFRAPDRFWMIAVFSGTILVGFGLDTIITDLMAEKPIIQQGLMRLVGALFLLATLFMLGVLFTPMIRDIWTTILNSTIGEYIGGGRGGVSTETFTKWQLNLAIALFNALAAIALFHFSIGLFGKKSRAGGLVTALILIAVADLYFMSANVPALRTTNITFFTNPPHTAQVLMADGEHPRFYSTLLQTYAHEVFNYRGEQDEVWYNGGGSNDIRDYLAFREELSPNIFMHWNLTSSNGFASLFLKSYFDLEGASKQQLLTFIPDQRITSESLQYWDDKLLVDLMASRYVLTPIPFTPSDHFTLVDDGSMKIYRNNDAYPRAWVARPESVMADTPEIERRFVEGEIDPRDELILNPLPSNVRTFPNGRSGTATANIRPIGGGENSRSRGGAVSDEQVLIDVYSPDSAYLILADTFYPGWKAEIDGVPVNIIYKAFGYFRAIEIPAGNHLVRFFYKPGSFTLGITLSVVTLGVSVILLIVQLLFFKKPKSSKD